MRSIYSYLRENLKDTRLEHTYAVRDTAINLARQYGIDEAIAETAALYHDMCKYVEGEELANKVKELGLDEKYIDNPNLAHSKLAAAMIKSEFDERNEDIINAVSYHTTGRKGMSTLEKIIYIADMIEPSRDFEGVDELRKLAFIDLDEACLKSMESSRDYVNERGLYMDTDTLDAIEDLKNIIKAKKGE